MSTSSPHEPDLLPKWLHKQGAQVIIASGMERRAQDLFPIDDYNFEQEVLDADLPVIMGFWAPRCVPYQVINAFLFESAKEHAGEVKIVKLNLGQNRR